MRQNIVRKIGYNIQFFLCVSYVPYLLRKVPRKTGSHKLCMIRDKRPNIHQRLVESDWLIVTATTNRSCICLLRTYTSVVVSVDRIRAKLAPLFPLVVSPSHPLSPLSNHPQHLRARSSHQSRFKASNRGQNYPVLYAP